MKLKQWGSVPSFPIAPERKLRKWKSFLEKLDKNEKKILDQKISISQFYNVAEVGSCKPVLVHHILTSTLNDINN